MAISKAGTNSQSGERLGALDSTGLTGTTVAEQLAELKLLIEGSGGGVFKVLSLQSGFISAGASGAFFNKSIADVPGATVMKVVYLLCQTSAQETGLKLTVDGQVLFSNNALAASAAIALGAQSTAFGVSNYYGNTNPSASVRLLPELFCESLVLEKLAGGTSTGIDWAIAYGVME